MNHLLPRLLLPALTATLLACSAAPPVAADDSTPPCATRSEQQCIDSPDCTLALVAEDDGGGYLCRDTANACEEGFRQSDGTPEECEAKEGCRFDPGRCYCPPDVVCICGGGPPPSCVPADEADVPEAPPIS